MLDALLYLHFLPFRLDPILAVKRMAFRGF